MAAIPKISIVMPVYNVEAYVGEAVSSIFAQTMQDFELILIDDGSTDASIEIALAQCLNDPRVHVIRQFNQGLSAARNRGMELAQGEYIYLFDSDDLLEADAFAKCIDWARRLDLDLVAFSGEAFSNEEEISQPFENAQKPDLLEPCSGEDLFVKLNEIEAFSPQCCLYLFRRKLLDSMPLRFDEGYLHEDEGFTPDLFCIAKRTLSLSARFFKKRQRSNSIMTSNWSFAHCEGSIQAAIRLNATLDNYTWLKPKTRTSIRLRQLFLLRRARNIAEKICQSEQFILMAKDGLASLNILAIDPFMLLYIRANAIYRVLRWAHRNIFTASGFANI